jgi:CubicO group peptidase (beta-lactamase class C family)
LKKYLLAIPIVFIGIVFWITEPFANNPFHTLSRPQISISEDYRCSSDSLGLKEGVGSVLEKHMVSGGFLGVSVGVLKQGCGLLVASSGYRDKRQLMPFLPNTINRLASITKPMTAIATMQLYEQGALDLDTPIQKYFPELPKSWRTITIRHLLSHTSGIRHYKSAMDSLSFSHYESLELATKTIFDDALVGTPGEQYIYSSYGFTVLGRIIEVVSGENYEDYLKKNIWQNAQMENTSLESSFDLSQKSRLYIKAGNFYLRGLYTDLSLIYPAGGVQSTAEDLLKFGHAILNNELISRESLEIMIDVKHSLAPEAGDDPYGLGWSVRDYPNIGRVISHGGGHPGVSAHFQVLLDKNVVSVAISNAFGTKRSAYEIATYVGNMALLNTKK